MFACVLLCTLLDFCFKFCLSKFLSKKSSKANFTNKSSVISSGFPHYSLDSSENTCLAVIIHSLFSSSSQTSIHG